MAKVIIFGVKDTAELAHFYLSTDSEHDVVAFCVNREYKDCNYFKGLPVFEFETVEEHFPVQEFKFFAPMTAKKMNKLRENTYLQIKRKGYDLVSYVSSKATVYSPELIGENCFILEDNTIQPFTKIGNNVVLWSGNHIGHHGTIGDHVFFTSHVVMSGHCMVNNNCFFGVNSTIRDYLNVAKGTLLGMASALTKDTEEWGVYIGNPATLKNKKSFKVY